MPGTVQGSTDIKETECSSDTQVAPYDGRKGHKDTIKMQCE